jgi:phosphoglycolate phosphatase
MSSTFATSSLSSSSSSSSFTSRAQSLTNRHQSSLITTTNKNKNQYKSSSSSSSSLRRGNTIQVFASMAHKQRKMDIAQAKKLLEKTKTFIFDCDGVIWKGDSLIDGVPETIDMLKAMGKQMFFITNNSTKSRAGYLKKFTGLGLNITAENIFSSSFAAAAYLESIKFSGKVYVVGETGIGEELDLLNIKWTGGEADKGKEVTLSEGLYMEHDKDVSAVIVGFDRHFNYHKIQQATLCIRENPGCLFIATNTDAVTHLTSAQEWAGNGSMVGCIKGSTQQEPIVVGKPSSFMLDYISEKYSIPKEEICMVGDRLDTDILFGKDGGLSTLLVLSGVTSEETLLKPSNEIVPDCYTNQLSDLLQAK